ncbi:ShlB/FhaC/HecB family hemolysin secretion/activation protein [Azospirillum brasilense]|uniref:ShlB/FhaC/HecB family hemolysin secretion/activation protein n=1 Tax=Azospirillum brasilense TaxID=192 RepID=UPI000E0A0361|nr:ShlB/FhaC/HecB family hemolysin secretion/activation protein [Azospirillum brasilense]
MRKLPGFLPIGMFGLALAAVAQTGFAQGLSPDALRGLRLPGDVEPGRGIERIAPPTADDTEPGAISVPQSPTSKAPAGAEGVTLVLTGIEFAGMKAYTRDEFAPLYQSMIGKTVTLEALFELANKIATRYREDGYFLSRALVPAQTIRNGVFTIQIIEGYVSDVVIDGDAGPAEPLIRGFVEKIVALRPVRLSDVERYLLLANDIPGYAVQSNFRRSSTTLGAAQLVITAQRKPFDGYATVDNYGSRYLGPTGVVAGLSANSFTPFGERTSLTALTTSQVREQKMGQLTYEQFIGSDGLSVQGFALYGKVAPGYLLEPLEVRGDTFKFGAGLRYPLLRSRDLSVYAGGAFEYLNGDTDVAKAKYTRDRLRVLQGSLTASMRDSLMGGSALTFKIRQGLPIMNASTSSSQYLSRVGASGEFTSYRLDLSRVQTLMSPLELVLSAAGQYSRRPLLASEQFVVGATTFGRGYDPAALSGDRGIAAAAELRYPIALGLDFLDSVTPYSFVNTGHVWNWTGTQLEGHLWSTGAGLRMNFIEGLAGHVEVSRPLTTTIIDNDSSHKTRFNFSLTYQY